MVIRGTMSLESAVINHFCGRACHYTTVTTYGQQRAFPRVLSVLMVLASGQVECLELWGAPYSALIFLIFLPSCRHEKSQTKI